MIQSYRPRSFRERGVAAPFTAPLLSGARLRRMTPALPYAGERSALGPVADAAVANASDRLHSTALEVLVPNPSGGKGVYILPWADIGPIWRPTMHDVELGRVLATMLGDGDAALTPALMRDAARRVAAEGLAGRAAQQAAARALQVHGDGLMATRFTLLMEATTQVEARGAARPEKLEHASPASILERGRQALLQLAANLGRPAHMVDTMLDTLALHFVDVGVGLGQDEASLPHLIADMGRLQHGLIAWAQTEAMMGDDDTRSSCRDARAVATASELAARLGAVLLAQARSRVNDMQDVIRTALTAPGEIAALCERPALLLDGWDQICLLWQSATAQQSRHAALRDIIRQVPLLPDEAEAWLGLPLGSAAQLSQRPAREVSPDCGELADLAAIARNEHVRAMAR